MRKTFNTIYSHALIVVLLSLSVMGASLAEDTGSRSRLSIPEPTLFLNPDTVSMFVVKANPDNVGFKALFDTAWEALSGERGAGSNWIYKAILAKVQGQNSNAFTSLLPAQFVRVDSMHGDATEPYPTTATTVTGWPGLQAIWYLSQGKGKDGENFPTEELGDATLILRDGYKNPTLARVLTKLDGTIVTFPTPELARYVVKRYANKDTSNPNSEIATLMSSIDTSHDTYGILYNRHGSALKLLRWLNKSDVARAESAVGAERLAETVSKVISMTWEGDLVSDDELKLAIRFQTKSPEARQELTDMIKEIRDVLDDYGRAGKMEASGLDNELFIDFQLVGYRDMLSRYIETNF